MPRLFTGKVILYLLLLLLLDVCAMPALGIFRPVLTYLWVLYIAFYLPTEVLAAALVVGIFRDLLGSQPIGVETAALVTTSMGVLFVMQKLEHGFFLVRMVMTFIFVFLTLIINLILSNTLASLPFSSYALSSCVTTAAGTAVLMPFFFFITAKWFRVDGRSLKQYELFG